ncbi:MAG TPA: ATP-binding protein [Acidobacteriota bacterium]|jgi:nitrogen fixation/metabolism regulation signal transduction histidine kinase
MPEKRRIHRQIQWLSGLLVFFLLLFLVSQLLLHPSDVGNENFLFNFMLWAAVWAINFLIVLALCFVLLRNLIKLFFEYRHERIGSKIKVKLVTVQIALSLLPSVMLFLIAYVLINSTLTRWFNAPGEKMIQSSWAIAESYYQQVEEKSKLALQTLSGQLLEHPERSSALLRESINQGGFDYVYWAHKGKTESAGKRSRLIGQSLWDRGLNSQVPFFGRSSDPSKTTSESFVTVLPGSDGVLAATATVPLSVAYSLSKVREAGNLSQETGGKLQSLKKSYFMLLGLTTLIVMFGFTWVGLYTAKKITVPIEALAEGSQQVSEGNLHYRIDCPAMDELGMLVDSFNRMTAQLEANRKELEISSESVQLANAQLETRKNFIETILQNIGTGVLSLDDHYRIQTANLAACRMFNRDNGQLQGRRLFEIITGEGHLQVESLLKRTRWFGTQRSEVTLSQHVSQRHVAVTGNSYIDPSTGKISYLVVLDDFTEFIRAEKFAAWQEVARRLAHEIKNPLTPIQLTAERLLKKYRQLQSGAPELAGQGDGMAPKGRQTPLMPNQNLRDADFSRLIEESARIISHESQVLKEMVDEFSRFARLPLSKPVLMNIHQVIDETVSLYEGRFEDVCIEKKYSSDMPDASIDPEQMRRVFVNLIDNSLEAMEGLTGAKVIEIRTAVHKNRESVQVELSDSGPGISAEDQEKLFLPYFSTKRRGTGLGLAIVRQIVLEHHGNIRAEVNHPRGSRFVIEVPAAGAAERAEAGAQEMPLKL